MRQKTTVTAPSETEAKDFMLQYADSSSQLKKLEGEMEVKIQAVREKYKDKVQSLSTTKETAFQKLQAYALRNRDELFIKRKSLDWGHGILGFRIGTPKVTKKAGITWAAMLDLVKNAGKKDLIRTKEDIDKEKIIASRDDEDFMKPLNDLGISVVQDETFFVEPKEEELAPA
ncbi:host-nuclease inhibitor Gam family protein [Reichenbachiella sp.]|uniref:host-nuclease inhibitor Gam family protein n=1 Tax=Reichenbachiella sp. TaxID=2184521 RepID=UPI003B598F66